MKEIKKKTAVVDQCKGVCVLLLLLLLLWKARQDLGAVRKGFERGSKGGSETRARGSEFDFFNCCSGAEFIDKQARSISIEAADAPKNRPTLDVFIILSR
jgi:hypothetical protein